MGNSNRRSAPPSASRTPDRTRSVPASPAASSEWSEASIRKLILDKKLAPRAASADAADSSGNANADRDAECPICFLNFETLNMVVCCKQHICTDCYVEMKKPASASKSCPFCGTDALLVTYTEKRTLASTSTSSSSSSCSPSSTALSPSGNATSSAAAAGGSSSSSSVSSRKPRAQSMGEFVSPGLNQTQKVINVPVSSKNDRAELERQIQNQRLQYTEDSYDQVFPRSSRGSLSSTSSSGSGPGFPLSVGGSDPYSWRYPRAPQYESYRSAGNSGVGIGGGRLGSGARQQQQGRSMSISSSTPSSTQRYGLNTSDRYHHHDWRSPIPSSARGGVAGEGGPAPNLADRMGARSTSGSPHSLAGERGGRGGGGRGYGVDDSSAEAAADEAAAPWQSRLDREREAFVSSIQNMLSANSGGLGSLTGLAAMGGMSGMSEMGGAGHISTLEELEELMLLEAIRLSVQESQSPLETPPPPPPVPTPSTDVATEDTVPENNIAPTTPVTATAGAAPSAVGTVPLLSADSVAVAEMGMPGREREMTEGFPSFSVSSREECKMESGLVGAGGKEGDQDQGQKEVLVTKLPAEDRDARSSSIITTANTPDNSGVNEGKTIIISDSEVVQNHTERTRCGSADGSVEIRQQGEKAGAEECIGGTTGNSVQTTTATPTIPSIAAASAAPHPLRPRVSTDDDFELALKLSLTPDFTQLAVDRTTSHDLYPGSNGTLSGEKEKTVPSTGGAKNGEDGENEAVGDDRQSQLQADLAEIFEGFEGFENFDTASSAAADRTDGNRVIIGRQGEAQSMTGGGGGQEGEKQEGRGADAEDEEEEEMSAENLLEMIERALNTPPPSTAATPSKQSSSSSPSSHSISRSDQLSSALAHMSAATTACSNAIIAGASNSASGEDGGQVSAVFPPIVSSTAVTSTVIRPSGTTSSSNHAGVLGLGDNGERG